MDTQELTALLEGHYQGRGELLAHLDQAIGVLFIDKLKKVCTGATITNHKRQTLLSGIVRFGLIVTYTYLRSTLGIHRSRSGELRGLDQARRGQRREDGHGRADLERIAQWHRVKDQCTGTWFNG